MNSTRLLQDIDLRVSSLSDGFRISATGVDERVHVYAPEAEIAGDARRGQVSTARLPEDDRVTVG